MSKLSGEKWRGLVTLTWADNPPRRDSKRNNRYVQEIRKRLVYSAGRHCRLFDAQDIFPSEELDELFMDAEIGATIPRSLREQASTSTHIQHGDHAAMVGFPYCPDRPKWHLCPMFKAERAIMRATRKEEKR